MPKSFVKYLILFLLAVVVVYATLQAFKLITNKSPSGTKKHEDETVKTVKDFPTLMGLKEEIQTENPKGENWSLSYQAEAPLTDKFVVIVDAKSSEEIFQKAVGEAFEYFKGKSFDPCKEPLGPTLFIQITNPAKTSWEPCK